MDLWAYNEIVRKSGKMKTLFKYLNEIVWEAISLLGKCVGGGGEYLITIFSSPGL